MDGPLLFNISSTEDVTRQGDSMSAKTEVVEVVEVDSEMIDDLEFYSSAVAALIEPAYNVSLSTGVAKEDNRAWNESVLDQLIAVIDTERSVAELYATIKTKLAAGVASFGETKALGAGELSALRSIVETRVSKLYTPFYNLSRIIEVDDGSNEVRVAFTKDGSTWTSVARWAADRVMLVIFDPDNWEEGTKTVHFKVNGVAHYMTVADATAKREEWRKAVEKAASLLKASSSAFSAVERQYRANHQAGMIDGRTKEADHTIDAVIQSGVEARASVTAFRALSEEEQETLLKAHR